MQRRVWDKTLRDIGTKANGVYESAREKLRRTTHAEKGALPPGIYAGADLRPERGGRGCEKRWRVGHVSINSGTTCREV
jgi:hypothetical protein